MNALRTLALAAVAVVAGAGWSPAQEAITTADVNMRAGPGSRYPVVTTVPERRDVFFHGSYRISTGATWAGGAIASGTMIGTATAMMRIQVRVRDRDHDRMRDDDDGVICRKRQYFNGPNPDLRCGSVNEDCRLRRRSGNKENVDEDMMS